METDSSKAAELVARINALDPNLINLPSVKLVEEIAPLASYLCWEPYQRCLRAWLKTNGADEVTYLALLQACLADGADLKSASKVLEAIVNDIGWDFATINERVVSHIAESGDIKTTAKMLERLVDLLPKSRDKVACLERLSGLYEKKLFDDQKLHSVYERLRKIDKSNLGALKYFKVVAIQNADWEEATKLLHEMLSLKLHRQDRYRAAHELATIQLYQLDTPSEAIETLRSHCKDSPLDASTLLFDAYHRIGNVDGCLTVLQGCYDAAGSEKSRSVLALRIGELYEQSGDFDNAAIWLTKSRTHNPNFLVALERTTNLALRRQDWAYVLGELKYITRALHDKDNAQKVSSLIERITELTGLGPN